MLSIRKIGVMGRTYRHVQRYRQILAVLFRYGFGDVMETLKIEQYLEVGLQMISRKRREHIEKHSRAERVKMALVELGPTFVKLGQILSTRPDLIPLEYTQELSKLQDNVPPFPYEEVKQIIESDLGAPLEQMFNHFEETPVAAASIGQVHRAQLKNGEEVAVKVQRPGIRKTIEVDLEIMLHLTSLMEKHLEEAEFHRPTKIVEEFARTIEMEIDYTIECSHMERFAGQFLSDRTVYVPRAYHEFSTARILTMEYIDGTRASDIAQIQSELLDKKKIARQGADLILKQIFVHCFFHADPHPGNIFILNNSVICYLDFGMMGRIDLRTRDKFADLIAGIAQRNEQKATEAFLALTAWEKAPERTELEKNMVELMDRHLYRPLKDVKLGKFIHQLLEIATAHRLRIAPDLFLMLKALSSVESLGRILDPDFDMISHAAPFVRRIRIERLHPRRISREIFESGAEFFDLLREIPRELRDILSQAREGRTKIEFEHRGLEPILSTFDRTSNLIAFAIVLASLVIGSSLIVLSDIPPKWQGIPVIGLAGFVIAGLMGFWLLISILRRGKI